MLTAANRMQLMSFAQIAIRIGGAVVVTLTLLTFARLLRWLLKLFRVPPHHYNAAFPTSLRRAHR